VSAGGAQPHARGWLGRIERIGNALPDPITLFALGAVTVFVASWVAAGLGWSCTVLDRTGAERVETARNLLSRDGLRWLATDLVPIYVGFKPLGLVLCASIGVGVAEKSGFIASALRAVLLYVPRGLLAPATLTVGIVSSIAADAGFVVLPPLAAAVYRSYGRPAALGIATVTAGVTASFGANPLLTSLDALLAGFTESSARLFDPSYSVNPACNWWFKLASGALIVLVGWFVSERIVAPRLAAAGSAPAAPEPALALPRNERRGLVAGFATMLVLLAVFVISERAEWGFLHGASAPDAVSQPQPNWIRAIIALIAALFFLPGLAYGIAAGSIRSDRDVARMLSDYFAMLASYLVLSFFAAVLVEAFGRSNLGLLLAVEGGNALVQLALPTWVLLVAFIGLTAALDVLVVSMSAKWALLATIFVPLFMRLGISPELTQAAYRIGDALSNPISPMNVYLVIVLAFLRRYDEKSGFGTLVALLAPFALSWLVTWIPLLLGWVALGLPLGPGGPLAYPAGG